MKLTKSRIPIGVDLDSTIADFPRSAILLLQANVDPEIRLAQWTSNRIDKCISREADACLREAMNTEEFWTRIEPMPGVIKELVKLMFEYEVHIITRRDEWIAQLTHDWLCLNEVPFDTLTLVDRVIDKLPEAEAKHCVGFIDDDQDICEEMHNSGLVVAQYIWPWNRTYEDMIRVSNWPGLAYAFDLKVKEKLKANTR